MEEQIGTGELGPRLTVHSQVRMQQRGITARMIRVALQYGERRWSHGAVCHRVTDRTLSGTPYACESERLRGLCVVTARDGSIVTVKWDYRLREPGPLRRRNAANWGKLRSVRAGGLDVARREALALAV